MTRFKSLLQHALLWLAGHMVGQDALILRGRVKVLQGPHARLLGYNKITTAFRILVAGILARASVTVGGDPVTYPESTGLDATNDVLPVRLAIGRGTDPAAASDTGLGSPILLEDDTPAVFNLSQVYYQDTEAGFGVDPIHVGFIFAIPEAVVFLDAEGNPTTSVRIEEWGLLTDNNTLCARIVSPYEKGATGATQIKWEVLT